MALDCEDVMRKWLGRGLTEEELFQIFEQAQKFKKQALAGKNAADAKAAALRAARNWAQKEKLAVIAKKRNIQLQILKRAEMLNRCLNEFKGREPEGVMATLSGSKFAREKSRLNVDSLKGALEAKYAGTLINEIKKLGREHYGHFTKGTLDREIARALWTLDNPQAHPYNGPSQAMDIARVIHALQERTRLDQKRQAPG